MPATLRSVAQAASGTTGSFTCTKPSGTQPNDILIAFHSCDTGPGTDMGTPTGGDIWQSLVVLDNNNGPQLHTKAWWKQAGPSEPASYGFTQNASADGVAVVAAIMGAAATTPVVASSKAEATATTVSTPSLTPTGADDYELRCASSNGAATAVTWTGPGGYTEQADVQSGTYATCCVATKALTSGGASGAQTFTPSVTVNTWTAVTVAVASAAGGTPKAAVDSATLTEQASIALSRTDSAALAESLALSVLHARSDTGALVETALAGPRTSDQAALAESATIAIALSRTDTGALTEAASPAATLGRTDAGALAEGVALAAAFSRTDSIALAEVAGIGLAAVDQVVLAESANVQQILGPATSDTAAQTESAAIAAQLARSDSVALAELANVGVLRSVADSATLTEEAIAGPLASDAVAFLEAATVSVTLSRSDVVTFTEVAALQLPATAADTGTLTELANVTQLGREITGVGQPYRTWKACHPERRWKAHPPRRGWSASSPNA